MERPDILRLMEKLRAAGAFLCECVKGRFYRGIPTGLNGGLVIDEDANSGLSANIRTWEGLGISYRYRVVEDSRSLQTEIGAPTE